jgi:hypothetical protein
MWDSAHTPPPDQRKMAQGGFDQRLPVREFKPAFSRDEVELRRFVECARAENPRAWARVEALRRACLIDASQANSEEHALSFALGLLAIDARS